MKESNDNIKVIENTFLILDLLFENKKMGIRELAKTSELAKTTVFRIIKTLESLNVIEQDIDEQYYLGLKLSKFGIHINSSLDLVQFAAPFMKELAAETGESINLGILHEQQALIIHTEIGESYTLQSMLQPISPLYCSGMGKIFLSSMTAEERKTYYQQNLVQRTVNSLVSLEQFEPEIGKILQQKIAFDHEEYEYGLSCVATPIYNNHQEIIAALSLSGPTSRLAFKGQDYLEEKLKYCANRISHIL